MSSKYYGKTCPYCKTPLAEGDTIVVCNTCDMPHHLSCWQDNQGCTTFGCTGTIREVIGDPAAPAAPQSQPAVTPVPVQQEKPLETLYESGEMAFMSDAPLVLENTALIIDRTQDKLFARCIFRCLSDQAISAVMIAVSCQDVWGTPTGEPVLFQYLDLNTKKDSKFGQTAPIELADKTTRKISVAVKKILYADGSVVDCGGIAFTAPAPVLLSRHLGSAELAAEYARETTPNAQVVPAEFGNYWLCACDALNNIDDERCYRCGFTRKTLLDALDPEALQANMAAFVAEKAAAEQRERAVHEARIRKAEEEAEKERKRQQEKLQRQIQAEENEKAIKKQQKIALGIALGAIALILSIVFWFAPYSTYQNACTAMNNKQFDFAYSEVTSLGDFLDSAEMADKALYGKAEMLLEEKKFDDAILVYQQLGDDDQLLEAKYLKADYLQSEERYREAYVLFKSLGNYKQSKDEVLATIILWEAAALSSDDTTEANYFVNTVTLESDHYEMYYTTILLYLNAHENAEYWYDWYASTASENVLAMLSLLPSNYKDTAVLTKLFNMLVAVYGESKLFVDNEATMRKCWSLGFVQDLAKQDGAITYFLRGYWTGSGYYLQFYDKDGDGSTWCSNNLPTVSKPSGTKYYNIDDMIYYWDGDNSKHLAKVFEFQIVNYDTIKVYCYQNGRTYTMYRD